MKKIFLILVFVALASVSIFAQTESRIIRMNKVDEDHTTYLEITSFKVENTEIYFNEPFTADKNWLKNIKVKVKNISDKPMTCIALHFGLMKGINEKIGPHMSWEYGLVLSKGRCLVNDKDRIDKKFLLKSGEETELNFNNTDSIYKEVLTDVVGGELHQARFNFRGSYKFKTEKKVKEDFLSVPNNVRYSEDDDAGN